MVSSEGDKNADLFKVEMLAPVYDSAILKIPAQFPSEEDAKAVREQA